MNADDEQPSALGTVLNQIKVKVVKKPKNYKDLNTTDLNLLYFVAKSCCATMPPTPFPSTGKTWDPFRTHHGGEARANGVTLPSLTRWNIVRKSRKFYICTDMKDAQKWWSSSRTEHELLTQDVPLPESQASASLTLLVCPTEVPYIVTLLRCAEVFLGVKTGSPADYIAGARICNKCHRYSVPRCFSASSSQNGTKCLNVKCRKSKETAAAEKKLKAKAKSKVQNYFATRLIPRSCSRCACFLQCREAELRPRTCEHTGKLLVHLCYAHRFVSASAQWLMQVRD